MFQVALTILDNNKGRILSSDDEGEAMVYLSQYLTNIASLEASNEQGSPLIRKGKIMAVEPHSDVSIIDGPLGATQCG